MNTTKNSTKIVTAALIGLATVLLPVNAPSQDLRDDQHNQFADAVANDSDSGSPRATTTGLVEQVVDSFDYEPGLSYEESRQLLKLSNASWDEQCELVRLGLSDERYADRFQIHAAYLTHALIALDPSGELSENLLQDIVRPVIRSHQSSKKSVSAAFELLMHLRVENSDRAALLLEWMNDESHNPSQLGKVLISYASQMRGDDATRMARLLVNRLIADPDQHNYEMVGSMTTLAEALPSETLKSLAMRLFENCERGQDTSVFIALASKLEPAELIPITQTILEFLRDEQDHGVLASHAWILRDLSEKLDADSILPITDLLLDRLETQKDVYPINMLSSTLADLAVKLDPNDLQTIVDKVIHRIKSETNIFARGILVGALAKMAANLEPATLTAVADLFADESRNQQEFRLEESTKILAALGDKLNPVDRVRYAGSIIDRVATLRDSDRINQLGQVLAKLIEDLDENDARPLGSMLIQQIRSEQIPPDRFLSLCEILATFAGKLSPDELLPVASVLVNRIHSEEELYQRQKLVRALEPLAKRLTVQQRLPFVNQIVDRMKTEQDTLMLADLGRVVAAMSLNLEASAVQPAIGAIATRIQLEQKDASLEGLISVYEMLVESCQPTSTSSFAMNLVSRLDEERDDNEVSMLASLIGKLSAQMSPAELTRTRAVMVGRLEHMSNGETLVQLVEVIGSLPDQPDLVQPDSERRETAELLLASLAQANYPESLWSIYSQQERLLGLQSIVAEAELQSLVDALKAPLLSNDLVKNAILGAIGDKIGRSFDGGLWVFVEWATNDPKGISLDLDLTGGGPWAVWEEPVAVEFPPLRGYSFQQQGTLEIEGSAQNFVVEGGVVYLPAGVSGLRLVDVSDPTKPREVGHADAGPHAIAVCVAGNYAYVTAGPAGWPETHLHVVDISADDAPRVVGSIDLPDYPSGVAVRGSLVYVADRTEGLRIIDVSNPRTPEETGFFKAPSFIVDVAVKDNYAILADVEVGLRAIDIAAPEDPKEVGLLKTAGPCLDVCVQGDRAYAATGDGGLVVVDISNPRALKQIATIPTEVAVSVSVHNNLAVVGAAKLGFRVFDLTDLAKPAAYDMQVSANGTASYIQGKSLFLADASFGGMPYGLGNQTTLRCYSVTGPGDAESAVARTPRERQSLQPMPPASQRNER
jgi:hypothetical protein